MDAPPSYCSRLHRLSHQIFYVSSKRYLFIPISLSHHRPFTTSVTKSLLFNESSVFFFSGRIRPVFLLSFADLVPAAPSTVSTVWRCDGDDIHGRSDDSSTVRSCLQGTQIPPFLSKTLDLGNLGEDRDGGDKRWFRRKLPWEREERMVFRRMKREKVVTAAETTFDGELLERLRNEARKMRNWVKVKKAGVNEGVLEQIRLIWNTDELAMLVSKYG